MHFTSRSSIARAVVVAPLVLLAATATARAEDWRPGPTDPVYLAGGVRAGAGPLWADSFTSAGSVLASGRAAVSFGDVGVGVALRAGFDVLSGALDQETPAGVYLHGDAWLGFFGMRSSRGFFERGAYVGLGIGQMLGTIAYGLAFHHPLIQLTEGLYLGGDITFMGQMFGSCAACPGCGCTSPHFNVQLGIEITAFD